MIPKHLQRRRIDTGATSQLEGIPLEVVKSKARHYTRGVVDFAPNFVEFLAPVRPGEEFGAGSDRFKKPVDLRVYRLNSLRPALVEMGRDDEVFVADSNVLPFKIEDHFAADRRGADKRNEGFPPDRPKQGIVKIFGIFVTAVTNSRGDVE